MRGVHAVTQLEEDELLKARSRGFEPRLYVTSVFVGMHYDIRTRWNPGVHTVA